MNTAKILSVFSVSALAAHFAGAVPVVGNVEMNQSSGKRVTITYSLSEAAVVTLEVQTNANTSASADDPGWTSIGGPAVSNAKGDVWKKVEAGAHTITWNPRDTWPDHVIEAGGARAKVTAWALDNTPDYMVVDISATAQPNTQKYYPSADFVPGGVTSGHYKTSTLLMRKIPAKDVTWTMGSTAAETERNATREATHQVTLTNNFYIGVFEVTQSQWAEIKTDHTFPSYFSNESCRATRPVENVSYHEIRNSDNSTERQNYDWPADPHTGSFIGLLRARTGIDFDLPGEAQWEFAARAGNGSPYRGDGSAILNKDEDENLARLGRWWFNGGWVDENTSPSADVGLEHGTTSVGSYAPNDWGLYDVFGNVWEFCLDRWEEDIRNYEGRINVDLEVPGKTISGTSTAYHVTRGGSWDSLAKSCRPAHRDGGTSANKAIGFRVTCTAGLQ
jgi:formylglycine-generating enzyme required for sulfatase activity